jgi:hypothetical protein
MAYRKYCASTSLEEVMETMKNLRIDSVPAEIQVRHLLYTSSVNVSHTSNAYNTYVYRKVYSFQLNLYTDKLFQF